MKTTTRPLWEEERLWPVCRVHGGVPKAMRTGWDYCEGAGWHPSGMDWDAPVPAEPSLSLVVS